MPRLFASLRRKLSGESCQCGATFADGAVFLHGGIRNITEINLVLRAKLGSKTSDSSANSAALCFGLVTATGAPWASDCFHAKRVTGVARVCKYSRITTACCSASLRWHEAGANCECDAQAGVSGCRGRQERACGQWHTIHRVQRSSKQVCTLAGFWSWRNKMPF